jgi:hypothetical protein
MIYWNNPMDKQKAKQQIQKLVEKYQRVCAKKAWQFLPVRVRIRQRLATSLTPKPHTGG